MFKKLVLLVLAIFVTCGFSYCGNLYVNIAIVKGSNCNFQKLKGPEFQLGNLKLVESSDKTRLFEKDNGFDGRLLLVSPGPSKVKPKDAIGGIELTINESNCSLGVASDLLSKSEELPGDNSFSIIDQFIVALKEEKIVKINEIERKSFLGKNKQEMITFSKVNLGK